MNYAIIGKGFIFGRHKQAIEATGGKILMTCDTRFNETHPRFSDWLEMYHHPDFKKVDAVIICTPNYLHTAMAREALLRGKKVLCEKPLSINGTEGLDGVDTVLQLRYHPELQKLRPKEVMITAKMYRDESYWNGWKGDPVKSGGILYNLGIHYLDLLGYLLGDFEVVKEASLSPKMASGCIQFAKGVGRYHIEILDSREGQIREVVIDGKTINLSNKDNLSYENLHLEVYKHFLKGEGVPLSEAKKSLELVSNLLSYGNN